MKLALALLAISSTVLAQTPTPAKPATSVTVQPPAAGSAAAKSSTSSTKPPSTLPRVPGVPHTMYSLKYIDTKIGTGPISEPRKFYTVNYTGYFPDGTKFDSTIDPAFKHPMPFVFPYGAHRVIIGWDTGFEGMRVGGKRRLYVPYQLAYGPLGSPPKMPAKANLIFDVELVSMSDTPPTPPAGQGGPGRPPMPRPTPPAAGAPPAGAPSSAPATPPATPPAAGTPPAPAPSGAPATPPSTTPAPAPAPPAAPAKPAAPPTL